MWEEAEEEIEGAALQLAEAFQPGFLRPVAEEEQGHDLDEMFDAEEGEDVVLIGGRKVDISAYHIPGFRGWVSWLWGLLSWQS